MIEKQSLYFLYLIPKKPIFVGHIFANNVLLSNFLFIHLYELFRIQLIQFFEYQLKIYIY